MIYCDLIIHSSLIKQEMYFYKNWTLYGYDKKKTNLIHLLKYRWKVKTIFDLIILPLFLICCNLQENVSMKIDNSLW